MASEAKLDRLWVPNEMCPATFAITDVEEQTATINTRPYVFYRLVLNSIYEFDAKFSDKNFLINTLGTKPEQWKLHKVTIGLEGKYKRIVSAE